MPLDSLRERHCWDMIWCPELTGHKVTQSKQFTKY